MFNIYCIFRKWNKEIRNIFSFRDKCIWSGVNKFSYYRIGHFSFEVSMLPSNPKIRDITKGGILKAGALRLMKNIMNVLSWRFYKSLGPFNMLTVKACSERCFLESGLTKSLTVCNFPNKVGMKIIFFYKCSKFNDVSKNDTTKSEEILSFQDHCIWIGVTKFLYCGTRFFSLPVNMLPSNRKI